MNTYKQKTLLSIIIKEKSTGKIILQFPPTRNGVKRAERYTGLTDLEIVKIYSKGG